MDQTPKPTTPPAGWAEALQSGRADVAAGRVYDVDTEALCAEIEAEADALEHQIAAPTASPG
jgi:hypothetical protein